MATLTDKMQQLIHNTYQEIHQKKQQIPTQQEMEEAIKSKEPRIPNAVILSNVKTYLKQTKPIIINDDKDKDKEKIQKKVKINKVSLEEEQILLLPKLNDIGGLKHIEPQIESMIYMPLQYSTIFDQLGSSAPKGILLTGTTGCGKTYLAKAICRDLYEKYELTIIIRSGAELVASLSGESEKNIRQLFQSAAQESPSVILIDDIDVIAGDRDKANKQMERRVVTQIMGSLDQLPNNVFLIATTSHPDQLDPALRRSGRFDKEIMINVPTDLEREDILKKLVQNLKVSSAIDLYSLSRRTPGYVASDLNALCREASVEAVRRISHYNNNSNALDNNIEDNNNEDNNNENNNIEVQIVNQDFELALKKVQPTAKREGFAVIPDVTWNEIGSLADLRHQLESYIVLPIQNPEIFQQFSVRPPAGVLLWGPPGCGKTLLAKAVANASRANFIAVKGPEILNKYVGESEKAIRSLFSRARASQPCIIFFDEIDAICPIRGSDGGGQVTERVVNQLLTELDGFEDRKQVYIVAASNRPDILDPAILRPGRIDKPLYVPLPDVDGRREILRALSKKSPLDEDINLMEIAEKTINFTGADLSHLITQGAMDAIFNKQQKINQQNFINSLVSVKPSIGENDRNAYEKLRVKMQNN